MSNAKRECKQCGVYSREFIAQPIGTFCTIDHAVEFAQAAQEKARARLLAKAKTQANKRAKAGRAQHRADKERVKPIKQWRDQLQRLVNQYVVHVRDKGMPCATCGTTVDVKYDAGHWLTRAARSDLRYNLYNINKQCSQKCNVHASGAKQEHEAYIGGKYGPHIVAWLQSNTHPTLKEQFPHYSDIKTEIFRYRKILRSHGLTPNG